MKCEDDVKFKDNVKVEDNLRFEYDVKCGDDENFQKIWVLNNDDFEKKSFQVLRIPNFEETQ